ncbi:CCA tRNA nucleotidyltransferase [Candidatus Peregrinibacteria bacterium]|nr:CCA tRNA nucleotidyltransferase [Candidatus Peregrinibacteria bacterium]
MQKTSIKLVKILQDNGYEAYWAGGCVRDMLIGKDPKDYDIVTDALPEEIEKLMSHTIPVGKQFGVIIAVHDGHHFEVATFRSDSGTDGRRPTAVLFTNAEEDAKRRDFTINGIFYDPIAKKIYDYVGGEKDLKARLIRFIGIPHERILEDHLRILRAIRFKNNLNFQYHPDTYKAVKDHANLSGKVSGERIREEFNKILEGQNPKMAFEDLQETGVLREILPELEAMKGVPQPYSYHHEGDVWTHSLDSLIALPSDASQALRWATFFHDIGKPATFSLQERIHFDGHDKKGAEIAKKILRRLKFSTREAKRIVWLIEHHMIMGALKDMSIARQRHWFIEPYFHELLALMKADIAGTVPSDYTLYNEVKTLYEDGIKRIPKEPKPLLTGNDVMKILKIKEGAEIGKILKELREKQLAEEITTRKEAMIWLRAGITEQ